MVPAPFDGVDDARGALRSLAALEGPFLAGP